MIPTFDDNGLLPIGIHDCSLQEIANRLCWTSKRQVIFDGLTNFLDMEWKPLGLTYPFYIDGSFVRNKPMPEDVDIVIDASGTNDPRILAQVFSFRFRHSDIKTAYYVDVWVKHPLIPNDLSAFFQYVGLKAAAELRLQADDKKGILRITP